ncbi:FHA domain-containing protein [Paenibacillus sepulcri]|uniref:Winged helix-turn-helix domain-containing protein n=1 Tax=Paenibacillus sepulcri TaxID=359917 RepID=A0ABS7CB93_9BACL|nr:winged helix-turn-helix domain-containing protein [Paenibacillus sepulcri]
MSLPSCLVVERGYPYECGTILPCHPSQTILGRKGEQWEPDMAFENAFVSRKQASIYSEHNQTFIMDLDSKHGTDLNGNSLIPFQPVPLEPSDNISFAKGMVVLTFSPVNLEETLDFTLLSSENRSLRSDFMFDPIRQTIRLHDQDYRFSEKEYNCLELLVRKEHQFVGKDEIIRCVWPERMTDDAASQVSPEELNSLLYRIRKKSNDTFAIESIRGKGYILHVVPPQQTPVVPPRLQTK